MDDSNNAPPRCPCGFWGSHQTMGLCSKCYREKESQKSEPAAATNGATGSAASLTSDSLSKAFAQVSPLTNISQVSKPAVTAEESSTNDQPAACAPSTTEETEESEKEQQANSSDSNSSGKRDIDDVLDPDRPVQKNKKRCFKCKCKLELAIREIGKCLCDYVFCQLHRLPEQHDCIYDHKEKGRQAAREKMVSPKKHMGTSLKRIDSDDT